MQRVRRSAPACGERPMPWVRHTCAPPLSGSRKYRLSHQHPPTPPCSQVVRTSSVYHTPPLHLEEQPPFLNAAALVATTRAPHELLAMLKLCEEHAGRDLQGGVRWGPRPLDLDIIFYGDQTVETQELSVPHKRWRERSFVTFPVADLFRETDATCDQVESL